MTVIDVWSAQAEDEDEDEDGDEDRKVLTGDDGRREGEEEKGKRGDGVLRGRTRHQAA